MCITQHPGELACECVLQKKCYVSSKIVPAVGCTLKTKEMKSTTVYSAVQTLGELRMRGTANWWAVVLAFACGLPLVARRESDMG